jgi:lipooligosaccharide transport system ATP-binding protein
MNNSNATIVSAHGLTKSYDHHLAVAGIDFDVHRGECLGVLGPNGAGKTTTLRMLLGLTEPTAGELTVLGYSIPQQARIMRKKVGVVPQHDNLDPDFTVIENLYTYANYFGLHNKQITKLVKELLTFAALDNRADAKVNALSGGMKRRLVLARALINNPELIILDEPTTGLDPQARQLIWQRLRSLKNKGTTLILTTHYMEEAQRLCDRLLIVDKGKILAEGKPAQLIHQHIEPHVFEVHGENIDQWYEENKALPNLRIERVGDTIFCYCNDDQDVLPNLQQWPNLEFMRRPGNLEDVFIKLTGRELRENS